MKKAGFHQPFSVYFSDFRYAIARLSQYDDVSSVVLTNRAELLAQTTCLHWGLMADIPDSRDSNSFPEMV
jgi:hypothetical protein